MLLSSLIDNLREAYSEVGVRPPSIIQDRLLETVVQEGEEILALDHIYGVKTTAVFDYEMVGPAEKSMVG